MDLHTRFPVTAHKGDPQAIIGYVTFKDMMLLAKTHPGNRCCGKWSDRSSACPKR